MALVDLTLRERAFLVEYAKCGNASEAARRTAPKPLKHGRCGASSSGYHYLRKIEKKLGGKEALWEELGLTLSKVVQTLNEGMNAKDLRVVVVPGGRGNPGDVREYTVDDHRSRIRAAEIAGRLIAPTRTKVSLTGEDDGPLEIRLKYLPDPKGKPSAGR